MWSGSGNCTRIPCTSGSRLSSWIFLSISISDVSLYPKLAAEVTATVPYADAKMGSKTYKNRAAASPANPPTLTIDRSTLKVTTGGGYTDTAD